LAERLTPPDRVADVRRLRGAAAEYRLLSGDYDTAFSLLESVASLAPPGPDLAEALLRLGRALVIHDQERRAVEVLTQAVREEAIPVEIQSSIHMWRSTALASLGDLPAALGDAEEALRLARSVDDPDALADALTALVATQVWLGLGLDQALVSQALELEASTAPRSVARRSSFRVASLLARTGEIDESRSRFTSLLIEAVGSGDDDADGRLHAELGWVEFLAGDWVASLDHLRKSVVLAPVEGSRLGALALVEAHLGEAEAASSHALEATQAYTRSGAVEAELLARSALGALELSLGNASGARDHLERAWQIHRLAGFGEPAMFPFVADHVMALIEVGADAEATEVVEWLEERGRVLERPWAVAVAARSRASLAATDGDIPAALEALTVALQAHERLPMPFELGRTKVIVGSILRRGKQKKSPREVLEEALAIFERLGARLWIARAQAELDRIGGRRRVKELTAVEERVARLARAGRTNREIAATLFMSVRTVEGHLSHIYAKLGIRSRTELAVFFDPEDEDPHP
jgi:DNA-binding CsgD family transcriptional regulator/tetratricopeptide (TPR) repeat protein